MNVQTIERLGRRYLPFGPLAIFPLSDLVAAKPQSRLKPAVSR